MSLQTIIKLLGWLASKLVKERSKLEAKNVAMVKQIAAMEKMRIKHAKDIAIANNMAKTINRWTAVKTEHKDV